ncbi:hypothetical protein AR457_29510 [Streptomyces agglomeratus]|uniref:DUF418 domain-containing protein n=1 Tax=Streptomyces agglomeratus TaxID=285458 RepID=A0A1E5PF39_9ACTN|nr:DUF418 domain-containing protein [Streptomyces agglomeratus]OEJ27994.1 hypothetical protein AS594_29395 [Streptomyces agglomeratus]OEJ37945.1 hypothetical protein BGK70_07140 [Streptomyces agglomeratus]OEJ47673.1 hypothetical protein AR457_29510 [Streptomyces agglomeratus]OEJ50473.1 hypothetical protein BGK72_06615 [Streptomyces agglomeratus]
MSTRTPVNSSVRRQGVTVAERSPAPDIARGFMLLLIALAHAPMYVTTSEPGVVTHPWGGDTLDRVITFLSLGLVDNRAYPMFAALFGYGMAMLVARQRAAGTTAAAAGRLLRRRGVFLVLFGLVHFVLIFPADILAPYGVAALAFGWLLTRGDRALNKGVVISAVLATVLATLLSLAVAVEESTKGTEGLRGTVWAHDYGDAVVERLSQAPFASLHILLGWPIVTAVLVGAVAARRRYLDDPARHRALLKRVVLLGGAVSVAGGIPLALIGAGSWHPGGVATGAVTALHVVTGFAGGLAYAAAFGLLVARSQRRGLTPGPVARALGAVGRRSLTCYLLQSSLLALVLARVAFGLGDEIHSTGAAVVAVCVWLTVVAVAVALERAGLRGPLDALMRRLVYGKPARRATGPAPEPAPASGPAKQPASGEQS